MHKILNKKNVQFPKKIVKKLNGRKRKINQDLKAFLIKLKTNKTTIPI